MKLETERLVLREMNQNDFESLKKIISDEETMKYYPSVYSDRGVQRWIDWNLENYRNFGFGLWAICLKGSDEMIGDCGITMQNIDGWIRPEIGYHLNKNYWRQGYMKEAGRAVRDWAFINTPFQTLYSYMNYLNEPSYSTAASIGMKRIGKFADSDNEYDYVYAITKEQWEKLKEQI